MDHYNLLIATPGRNVDMPYLKSLLDTVEILNKAKISYKFINQYSSNVSTAREGTIMDHEFMDITNNKPLLGKATYDKILWIDSDMSWKPEDVLKLYKSKKEIISGMYISDLGRLMYSPSKPEHLEETKPIEISYAGFGFICVKQGVFESLPRPWFQTRYSKKIIDDQEYLVPHGEDYSWCATARENGYKIFVDPTVRLVHHKQLPLEIKT